MGGVGGGRKEWGGGEQVTLSGLWGSRARAGTSGRPSLSATLSHNALKLLATPASNTKQDGRNKLPKAGYTIGLNAIYLRALVDARLARGNVTASILLRDAAATTPQVLLNSRVRPAAALPSSRP